MGRNAYIIGGPNGAGKTTFARELLPRYADCRNFVNADLIAQGVSPFAPDEAAIRAGRLMLDEIEHMAERGVDFGFESTLSGRTHLKLMRNLKGQGYRVHLFYLWLPTVELALSRVKGRVMTGGHNVPERVVRRRFERSLANFFRYYRALADTWLLFDNSGGTPREVASCAARKLRIIEKNSYDRLNMLYGAPK